ncbi:hypothetical protein [Ekhidna sp.]
MKKSIELSLIRRIIVMVGVVLAIVLLSSCKQKETFQAPMFEEIGDYRMDVSSSSKNARKFFDQGMVFTFGFNHGEAARSFREAIRLDSNFVMAYWGLAYALGPNYNAPLDPTNKDEIMDAVYKASKLKTDAESWQKDLIESIEIKYVEVEEANDPQLEAFAQKMKELSELYNDNVDIQTLYAEALMLLHPWDLYDYKGGPAKTWTPVILSVLDKALDLDPKHPLANHLYIHATEASDQPGLAWNATKELSSIIIPGAGHIVHMPSHTYINTGDYHLGTEVNLTAVIADSIYLDQCESQGAFPLYYYHNYHFLAACAALEGRGALAIESSFKMTNTIDKTLLGTPGFETTQHFMTIPYNVLVKFAQWEKILTLSAPDKQYPYMTTIWHYARGMAYANLGQVQAANNELISLKNTQNGAGFSEFLVFGINPGQMVVDIAMYVLEAEIAQKGGDYVLTEDLLLKAVAVEDSMSYNEPPDWFFSVRHILGDFLMKQGRYMDAEEVYKADLSHFPKNGFALNGLYHSLLFQSKKDEANKVKNDLETAWSHADSDLKFSRIDEGKRRNLALKVEPKDPSDLMRISTSFCSFF